MRAADAAPESPPKGGSLDEQSSPNKDAAEKGEAAASDEDFESFPALSSKNPNASASQDEPPPQLPPLLPPPPPAGWRWPREGDRVEIEVEEEGATLWRAATVVSVISTGPEAGWFSARMLHDDERVDWFTWQEEGKDWRRTGGKRKLSATASKLAEAEAAAGAAGADQKRKLSATASQAAADGGDVNDAAIQVAAAAKRAGKKASKKPAKRVEEVLLVGDNHTARADEPCVHEDNDQDGVDRCGDDVSEVEPAEPLGQTDENVDGKGTAAEVKVVEEAGGRRDVGGVGRNDGGGESDVRGGSRLTAAQQEELVEVINAMKRRGVDDDTTVHGWRVRFKTRSCQTNDGRRKGDWSVTTPSDETHGRQNIFSFVSLQRYFDGGAAMPARPRLLGLSPCGPDGSAPAGIGELNGIAIQHAIILEILAHAPACNVPPPAACADEGMRSAWAQALRQHASEAQQCRGACGRPFCIVLAGALTHVADCSLHKPCRICEGARETQARLAQGKAAVEADSDADASAPAVVAAVAEDASSGSTSASECKPASSVSLGEERTAVRDGAAIAVAEHVVTSIAPAEPEPGPEPEGELVPEEETEMEASQVGMESVPSAVPSAVSTNEPKDLPVSLPERSGPWLVGDRVEARYLAQTHGRGLTKWYVGSVIAAHSDCTYDILYFDGESEYHVPARFVRDARLSAPAPNRKSARAAGRQLSRKGLERPSHPASRISSTVDERSELKQSRWQAKADEPPPSVMEIAELLTFELRVGGTTLTDKVDAGCFRLGIDTNGKTVAQKAAECWAALSTQATEFMREVEASVLPPPAAPPACYCIPPRPASFWRDRWCCDAADGLGCGLELRVPETPFTPLCRCQPSRPMRWVLGRWWCAIAADTNDAAKGCGHELPPDRPSAHPEPTLLRRAGSAAQPIGPPGSSARALRCNGGPLERAAAASTAALLTAAAYGPMNAASFVAPFSSPSPPVVAVVAAHAAAAADAAADTFASSELVRAPTWVSGSQRPLRPPPSAAVFEGKPDGGLGLFARTRLKKGDVIGELSGPRVPFWLLDTTVLRMKQPVCPWWLEAPADPGARGRSASMEPKTADNNALKRASAFFVDGTRQLEPLLRSLVSAKPLLECLVAAAPANESNLTPNPKPNPDAEPANASLNASPHLASTRGDAPAAPSSRTLQLKSDVTGSVIQGPLTQVRWPATFARISSDYCNATTKTQVGYNGSKGETRLWLVADRDIERGEAIGVDPACCSVPEFDGSARGRPSRKVVDAMIPRAPETMTPPELGRDRLAKLQRLSGMRLERQEHDADDAGSVIDVYSDGDEEVCGAEPVPASQW